ncbi:rubrerythrin-like domain-containing protein [Halorussus marinus]|nr:rubrerythrin-like domain-containing protein [Halorussus marinus]
MSQRDVTYDADDAYEYECLRCAETVRATGHPGGCPECASPMRNRRMPYE